MKTITLVTKKKKSRKKKSHNEGRKNKRKKIKPTYWRVNFKGIFESSFLEFLPLSFLSILKRTFWWAKREKLGPHHLFFCPTIYFSSPPPN